MSNKILAIEYDESRRPFTVWTSDAEYSFEHSKNYGVFYYNVGSGIRRQKLTIGGPCEFWSAPEIVVTQYGSEEIVRLPEPVHAVDEDGFPIETVDDLAQHLGAREEVGALYCRICDDRMPSDEKCAHMFYSDNWGDMAGPGACDDATDYTNYINSLAALVKAIECPPEALIADLEKNRMLDVLFVDSMIHQSVYLVIGGRSYRDKLRHALTELRDETLEGFGWLSCLRAGETDEDAQRTISWLRGLTDGH